MERNTLRRTTARRERRAAIRRRRILCSNEQSKLCPCPTKSLLSDKDQLAHPGRGNPLQSRGFWKRKKVQTNNLMHYGENNRDKDRQETQE